MALGNLRRISGDDMAWDDPKTPHEELTYQVELKRDLRLYNGADASAWFALKAVVKLHMPYQDHVTYCQECEVIYPCPTIRAIETELN